MVIISKSQQEIVQHSAPQNIKESINKTDEKSDDLLIWKIEKNMLGRLDQTQLNRGRALIAQRKKIALLDCLSLRSSNHL